MDLRLATGVCSSSTKDSTESIVAILCALDSQGLTHDRASPGKGLQVGNGSSTRRYMTSGGGEGAKCGRRSLVEEGAHRAGLSKKSLHRDVLQCF